MSNPNNAAVQHTVFRGRSVADCLADVGTVCAAGAQSPDVQNSPPAQQALVVLQKAVTTANASLNSKLALVQALVAATKSLEVDFGAVKDATTTYESAVNAVAAGNATVITKAGLLVRGERTPPAALGEVSVVHTKPGKHTMEAILNWPKTPGATGYAIEVNFTPQNPAAAWTALNSGSGRRRVITAPTAGAQFLVRVAALASDGTQSAWSAPILATAL